nr:MAG TPA: hypothetical protein [Caudoviricetes sp.]
MLQALFFLATVHTDQIYKILLFLLCSPKIGSLINYC